MFWRKKRDPVQFIAFGLGNPGLDYVRTRHNAGWWVLDELARRYTPSRTTSRHRGQVDYCEIAGRHCALVKPLTLMNRSGQCVLPWTREHPEAPWVVVCDDISLKAGKPRLRLKGSSGGQKGIQHIIDLLGHDEFPRVKIGVGAPEEGMSASEWVLTPPERHDEDLIMDAVGRAADAVVALVGGDTERARLALAPAGPPDPPEEEPTPA